MRRLSALVLLVAVGCPVRVGSQEEAVPPHPHALRFPPAAIRLPSATGRRIQLGSGPIAYLAEDHAVPLVEIGLALRVGSFLDPPGKSGLAYLTGSQLRRAGGAGLSAHDFDERVDELGARIDTVSGTTRAGASLSVPSWALEEALDLFVGMLSQPGFQPDRLAAARSNLIEGMTRRNENALEVLQREWEWLMLADQHFSTRPLTPAGVEGIRRADLVQFHRRYWRPGSMILAISGAFERSSLLAGLERRFANWPGTDPQMPVPSWPPPQPRPAAPAGLYHYEADVPQAKVMLGHRTPTFLDWQHPDRLALEVLAEVLGGQGAISRIAGRLRTAEGLVYRASAELDPGELWPGDLRIFFETESRSVARAVQLALEEVERVRTLPVHPKELAVAQKTLLARLRLAFDTAEEVAGYFAEDELLDRPHDYWQDYLEGIDAVTAGTVLRAAQDHIQTSRLVFLVVGRWAEISADGSPAGSSLEEVTGHSVVLLPPRDPLTLEAVDPVTARPPKRR